MGISLKDIFKSDEEKLVKDRHKAAIRNLIIFSCVIFALLIGTLVIKFWSNKDEERRLAVTKDVLNIQTAIKARAEAHITSNGEEEYPGISLEEQPAVINNEEYRYGYYYLDAESLGQIAAALNLPEETYIVNYETGDVVNVNGIKYNKRTYYSIKDLDAIEKGQTPPSDTVIIISKASDLNAIKQRPSGYFKLSANIDMSEITSAEGWEPIPEFNGVFDGRGYTISNLSINRPTKSYVGLFGDIKGNAEISNLHFENVNIIGGEYTGVLAGYCSGTISNVHVNGGNVMGYRSSTGALVGAYGISKISNCTVKADVEGKEEVGGIAGSLYSGIIQRVSFEGSVTSTTNIGGGLIGLARVSSNSTEILECVSRASVNGNKNLGGLIGEIEMNSNNAINILNSYATGSIESGTENLGGLFGYIYTAQGTPTVRLEHLYADVGVVVKGTTSGGFIGNANVSNSTTKNAIECYWKKDLAPGEELSGTGSYTEGSEFTSSAKTPTEMTMRSQYTNWDFVKIWDIEERVSSAFLRWEKN